MAQAIANRYAVALADVLAKKGDADLHAAASQLRTFHEMLARSAELQTALTSPAVDADQKRALVDKLCERAGIDRPIRNLLLLLVDRRRLGELGEIAQAVFDLDDERAGVVRLRVSSPQPLTEEERRRLEEHFAGQTGKQTVAEYSLDEELLGGVVVRLRGRVYDGSVRGQLRRLSRAMAG